MTKQILISLFISMLFLNNSPAQIPGWEWVKKFGTFGNDNEGSVAIDREDNVIIGGKIGNHVFISKYDPSGNLIWTRESSGASVSQVSAIKTDAENNIIVAGAYYNSTIVFDTVSLPNQGSWDMFLLKYDINGNLRWAQRAGMEGHDNCWSIAIDSKQDIVLTGGFQSAAIMYDNDTLTNAGSGNYAFDAFIVKYDLNGNEIWATSFGSDEEEQIQSVDVDKDDNIYLTGEFWSDSIQISTTTLINGGSASDVFLAKYNSSGTPVWVNSAGGKYGDHVQGITIDRSNDIVITGYFGSDIIHFNGDSLINAVDWGGYDLFLAKYNSSGNEVWVKKAGSTSVDGAYCVAAEGNDLIVVGIFSKDQTAFGSYILSNHGEFDLFVAKFDSSGTVLWVKSAGGTEHDESYWNTIAADSKGNIYVCGHFFSPVMYFDSIELANTNPDTIFVSEDIFLGKLSSILTANVKAEVYSAFIPSVHIFPNPFHATAVLQIDAGFKRGKFEIYNASGQLVRRDIITNSLTEFQREGLAEGIYFYRILLDNGQAVNGKFVIQ